MIRHLLEGGACFRPGLLKEIRYVQFNAIFESGFSYFHLFIMTESGGSSEKLKPRRKNYHDVNPGVSGCVVLPLCWFFLNNSERVKAVTLAF